MSWTKREIIAQAYAELGLANYVFDLSPDQQADAMRRLNSMLGTWNARGIRIGYTIPAAASGGDLDDDSAIPDSAIEATYLNLAVRLAGGIGRQAPSTLFASAKDAYTALISLHASPIEKQLPTYVPLGAGNKPWRFSDNEYVLEPDPSLLAGGDGPITTG